jgi:ankyrin repeat protein
LVDTSNWEGQTPLMIAARRGNVALAHLLLERGANVARTDTHGMTAAAYAAAEGYGELAAPLSKNLKY